jgi:hypothetical protein
MTENLNLARPTVSPRRLLVPLALAQFICSFAGSNMNVMINDISTDLDTTVQGVQTAITLFLLVMDDHRGAVADRRLGADSAVPGPADGSTAPIAPAARPSRTAPTGPPVPRLAAQGPVEVVRSEEELQVGVRRRLRRLRLRKYVVTEYLTRTIPVRREEVRLEEVPAPAESVGEPGDRGAVQATGDQPLLEVVLHREEPVIQLRVVPAERVRLFKDVVTEQRTVTEEVRKEQIDLWSDLPGQPADPDSHRRR